MSRRLLFPVLLLAISALAVSCTDADLPSEPLPRQTHAPVWSVHTSGPAPYALPPGTRSRWDAPWWNMSDAALADSI